MQYVVEYEMELRDGMRQSTFYQATTSVELFKVFFKLMDPS